MDARIDLTENRDFRKRDNHSLFLSNFKLRKFPWMDAEKWYSTNESNNINVLFLTGDKKTRLNKKRELEIYNNIHCDKCGNKLKPWGEYYGLCSICDKEEKELIIREDNFPMTKVFKEKLLGNNKRKVEKIITVDATQNNWISFEDDDEWFL